MLYPKQQKGTKNETPTRTIHSHSKLTHLNMTKKSDPFLKDLKDVYDK